MAWEAAWVRTLNPVKVENGWAAGAHPMSMLQLWRTSQFFQAVTFIHRKVNSGNVLVGKSSPAWSGVVCIACHWWNPLGHRQVKSVLKHRWASAHRHSPVMVYLVEHDLSTRSWPERDYPVESPNVVWSYWSTWWTQWSCRRKVPHLSAELADSQHWGKWQCHLGNHIRWLTGLYNTMSCCLPKKQSVCSCNIALRSVGSISSHHWCCIWVSK
jgi:hypothetical protein